MIAPAAFLPRTVVVLGLVSLLNDAASEMITPLLPIFLTATLGAGPAIVGLVEGVAEATASILKLVSGWLADRGWPAKGLVLGGYTLSNAARPLIGLVTGWIWVLLLRFSDRLGKGLRTAPRDALISAATDQSVRGRAFGFHRAMDHTGSMLGPLLAFSLLGLGMDMEHVFISSVLPGVLVLALLLFALPAQPATARPAQPRLRWHKLDARLRALILASGGLALASVPEAFLVLWAFDRGLDLVWVPLLWAAASAVKAAVAIPGGALSDRFGRLPVVAAGWGARVVLLAWLAFAADGAVMIWSLFLTYAAVLAYTEAAERALIGDCAPERQKATAFGLYHLVCGILALPGAVIFGLIWQGFGAATAFVVAALLTTAATASLLWATRKHARQG